MQLEAARTNYVKIFCQRAMVNNGLAEEAFSNLALKIVSADSGTEASAALCIGKSRFIWLA